MNEIHLHCNKMLHYLRFTEGRIVVGSSRKWVPQNLPYVMMPVETTSGFLKLDKHPIICEKSIHHL